MSRSYGDPPTHGIISAAGESDAAGSSGARRLGYECPDCGEPVCSHVVKRERKHRADLRAAAEWREKAERDAERLDAINGADFEVVEDERDAWRLRAERAEAVLGTPAAPTVEAPAVQRGVCPQCNLQITDLRRERDEALARGRAEGVAACVAAAEEMARRDEGAQLQQVEYADDYPVTEHYAFASRRLRALAREFTSGADALSRLLADHGPEAAARALEAAADDEAVAHVEVWTGPGHYRKSVPAWLRERAMALRGSLRGKAGTDV